jgi:hypothetical protein
MRRHSLTAGLVLVALLAGCGTPAHSGNDTVRATSGNLTVEARPDPLAAGDVAHFTVIATGPIDYEAGCVDTVHLWALDGTGQKVWEQPTPAVRCMALAYRHLAAGEVATFAVDWPTAPSLARGRYAIHGLFRFAVPPPAGLYVQENLPVLTVQVVR